MSPHFLRSRYGTVSSGIQEKEIGKDGGGRERERVGSVKEGGEGGQ